MDLTRLKVGDHIMYDGGGVAYVKFAEIVGIEKKSTSDEFVLKLKHIYQRQRVSLYPGNEDVFDYTYNDTFHVSNGMADRLYKITKTEFNAIAKAYEKFSKIHEQTCIIYREIYFKQKRK